MAGTCEGDSHSGIDSYTFICRETLNPKSYGGGVPPVLRRGCRGQGQHDLVGPWLAGPSEVLAGTCEGDSHNGIGGRFPKCFAEAAVGRGSTIL